MTARATASPHDFFMRQQAVREQLEATHWVEGWLKQHVKNYPNDGVLTDLATALKFSLGNLGASLLSLEAGEGAYSLAHSVQLVQDARSFAAEAVKGTKSHFRGELPQALGKFASDHLVEDGLKHTDVKVQKAAMKLKIGQYAMKQVLAEDFCRWLFAPENMRTVTTSVER